MKRGQLQPCEGLLTRLNLSASWRIPRKDGARTIFLLSFFGVEISKHTQSKENDIKGMQHHLPITQFQQLSKVCHSCSATHTHTNRLTHSHTFSFLCIYFGLGVWGGWGKCCFLLQISDIMSFLLTCHSIYLQQIKTCF